MALEPLYKIKVKCAYCENVFETSRVRHSLKKAYKTDTDFCAYYKTMNPDYYVVRVCPACGFASTENFGDKLSDKQRKDFESQIKQRWVPRAYEGERSWEQALETYQLALLCAQAVNEKKRLIASLLHHIAWLYRYRDDHEQEQRFMQYTLQEYIRVYELEGVGANNARLLYLIGEINRRLGNYNEAVKWFSRVVHDKKIMDGAMIRASREQWQAIREEMAERKLEPTEEMKAAEQGM